MSGAYQPSIHCHNDRSVGTCKQLEIGKLSASLFSETADNDIAHYVVSILC